MKKFFSLLMGILISIGIVSCRENNTDVKHHSESGHVDDNPVDNPGTTSGSDSTDTGADNAMPAQSTDTVGNNKTGNETVQ